ncbi:MAG: ribbon-helix-helix domain-containing protein [Gemmatimonadales bacterium]
MPKAKVAITVDEQLLAVLDRHVAHGAFANRSQAVEAALDAWVSRLARTRLATESAKLDAREEQRVAEEAREDPWPDY